ncbi:hypothetical protein E2P81_ATG06745 [Venturia nashicola]|uniref:Alcohol acetyltransferase n=1 Tax=Venturia nashicola TaxID=86259 RepID=A0A4Z1PCT8_9PEZI|nr:hypothetical protein E6O75_ATG06917 [Venturia nashicola]TLD30092.1 hypothetical protein E2P81_ATG06745 [Venturia nashicola]
MDLSQLKKIRAAGKLEEMAVVAHELDLYTTAGYSVHYKPARVVPEIEPLIYKALAHMLREKPALFAVPIVPKHQECYFARLPSIDLRKVTSFVERQGPVPEDGKGRDPELDALLRHQVNTNYKSEAGIVPVWRLIILYDFQDKQQFTANLMVHHGIADGASLQILHRSLQKALQALSSTSAMNSEVEYIIPSKDEEIGPSLDSIHSLPIPDAAPGDDTATYNDWLGHPVEVPSRTGYATLTLPPPLLNLFTQECKKNKVATPAGLNALLAKALYSHLPSTTESMDANIPVDIRSNLPPEAVDGVMGNFYDTFKTRIFRADFCEQGSIELTDIWTSARKITKDTRKYFANTAPSGEAYLNAAVLKNVPDSQALQASLIGGPRTESLELAYIGPHVPFSGDKSGSIWQAGKTTVSRCAYAAGACVQATAVLHDEGITIGFAWPLCAIEENLVEKTIDGIREYFIGLEER